MNEISLRLIEAKALIVNPENWIANIRSVDKDNDYVEVESDYAIRFCAIGALRRNSYLKHGMVLHKVEEICMRLLLDSAAKTLGYENAVWLNDMSRDHNLVMQMFDLAIEMSESSEVLTQA